MPTKEEQEKQPTNGEPESDTEGHSMFLYEGARHIARDHERDAQRHARDAKMLKDNKPDKGRR